MKAFVDSREPKAIKEKINGRLEMSGIIYESKELPQADFYLPEKDVAIERKEASDFASSTTEGRLSKQADRMIAEHDHVFVIIENDIHYRDGINSLYDLAYSNVSSNSLTGMQTSLAVKRGIRIIYTESIEQTLYAVERIFERFMDEEHESADGGYVKTADTGEVDDTQVAMLMQIDGISKSKAEAILEEYTDLTNMVTWADGNKKVVMEGLQDIDGIGPTLAERVINAFQ